MTIFILNPWSDLVLIQWYVYRFDYEEELIYNQKIREIEDDQIPQCVVSLRGFFRYLRRTC